MRGEEEEEDDLSFYICRDPFHFLIGDEDDEDIHMCIYKYREREGSFHFHQFPCKERRKKRIIFTKGSFLVLSFLS